MVSPDRTPRAPARAADRLVLHAERVDDRVRHLAGRALTSNGFTAITRSPAFSRIGMNSESTSRPPI
jgi:hypothetical protein